MLPGSQLNLSENIELSFKHYLISNDTLFANKLFVDIKHFCPKTEKPTYPKAEPVSDQEYL